MAKTWLLQEMQANEVQRKVRVVYWSMNNASLHDIGLFSNFVDCVFAWYYLKMIAERIIFQAMATIGQSVILTPLCKFQELRTCLLTGGVA